MSALNFNNLPSDIKSIIFKINKDKEKEEYIENKNKYNEVINTFGTFYFIKPSSFIFPKYTICYI